MASSGDDIFPEHGEVAALIRAKSWDATPLGPVESWPQSLRTVLRLMLSSRYAMWMGWGPDLSFFYNDAYMAQTLGAKHPWALGQPARAVWAEIWQAVGPRIDHVLRTGEATWDEGLLLFLERSGFPEETYHTFSYSPAPGDAPGEIAGMFCVVIEETERVIGERRIALLRDFATLLSQTKTTAEVFGAVERCLTQEARDFPFSLVYLFEPDGKTARRAARVGFDDAHPAAPEVVPRDGPWPLRRFFTPGVPSTTILVDLPVVQPWPTGPWRGRPTHALLVPIHQPGLAQPIGAFVAAVNPHRPLDGSIRSFAELFVGQLAASLSNARAFEHEKERAEALAEVDRAKTAFFSNVSHEFRTPLTLLLGPVEDAIAAPDRALRGVDLDTVHRNGLRLLKLVNALLDFARIEAGRTQASFEATDLSALTADLASSFRSAIERAGLRFDVACEAIVAPAFVDRDMWEKIVLNLLSNALKFTFEGAIGVRLRQVGEQAVLTLSDTGIGIPPAEMPHLFERFHRVRGARSRTHEGSGIGLALVHDLVKSHGGEVRAQSVEGAGTTFDIRIPLGSAHLPADKVSSVRRRERDPLAAAPYVEEVLRWIPQTPEPPQPAAEVPPSDPRVAVGTARIVLADDNADMREYLARLLGARWRVEAVGDGQAALDAVRRAPPDLIVSDVMMPILDGFGLLRAIRADPATRTVPVVLLSARAGEEATAEGLAAGANDYVVKPFSARELLARVSSQLAIAEVRRVAEREREAQWRVLEALFADAPAAVALVRGPPGYVIQLVNARALELWRRPQMAPSAAIGTDLFALLPELRGDGMEDALRRVIETGEPYAGNEVRVAFVRGGRQETAFVNVVYVPMHDASGVIGGVAMFGFEVTEQVVGRKRAELGAHVGRAFVTSEPIDDQLRHCCEALVEQGAALARIWTYDATRDALEPRATAGAEGAASGPRVALRASKIGRIVTTREPVIVHRRPGEAVLDDPEVVEPAWAEREGVVAFAGYPLVVGDRLVGVVALFARREISEELATAVGAVADQIALGIDRDASERFRELFIGVLGHDLRNPLNAIMMGTHLLSLSAAEPAKKTLTRIDGSAKRMQRMIAQVLDFTRARAMEGGIPLTRAPADLRAICEQVIEELTPAFAGRAIELDAAGEARGMWDADRMAQVFSNLVGNALAYGDKGAPIRVALQSVDGAVRFSVHNFGPPIPDDVLAHLFDPFRRARHAKDPWTQGLGLGLYISQQIVLAHGGSIRGQSSETRGTVFIVTLPLTPVSP